MVSHTVKNEMAKIICSFLITVMLCGHLLMQKRLTSAYPYNMFIYTTSFTERESRNAHQLFVPPINTKYAGADLDF